MVAKQKELNDQLRDRTLAVSLGVGHPSLTHAHTLFDAVAWVRGAETASKKWGFGGSAPRSASERPTHPHPHPPNPPQDALSKMAKSRSGAASALNNVLMQMRKVANHPDLITSQFEDSLYYPSPEVLVEQCGKMRLMDRLLNRLHANGHKVLIFSQMTKMLDLIDSYLDARGLSACRIDGNISWQDRQDAMKRFNTDPSVFAFLLSTRAGGLGELREKVFGG